MRTRRPSRTLVTIWVVFLAFFAVGLSLLLADSVAGPVLMIVGATGYVATGLYIFVTTPRTGR